MIDFQKLIAEVKAQYKPQYDYTKLRDLDLTVLMNVHMVKGLMCVTRILSLRMSDMAPEDAWKHAHHITMKPNVKNLKWLYGIHPDRRPLEFLVWLDCNQYKIVAELSKRTESYPLGRELLRNELDRLGPSWLLSLWRLLGVEKTKTSHSWEDDTEELLLLARDTAIKHHKDLGQSAIGGLVNQTCNSDFSEGRSYSWALPVNLGLPAEDKPPWDEILPQALAKSIEDSLAFFIPILCGDVDNTTPEKVRHALEAHKRGQLRREARRERGDQERYEITGLLGLSPEEAKQVRLEKWEWAGKEPPEDRETRRPVIRPGMRRTNSAFDLEIYLTAEEEDREKEYHLQLLWDYQDDPSTPQKRRKFLKTYFDNRGNMTATCGVLEISPKTGYEWLAKITDDLLERSKKTPFPWS